MIKSGELKHIVHVKIPADTEDLDEYGKPKEGQKGFRIRCNVQIISGTELIKNGISLTSEYISIKARYDKRLKQNFTLVWRDGEYNLDMLRPNDSLSEIIITASREF